MSSDPRVEPGGVTPAVTREGVRDGILAALEREEFRTGGWAAWRLGAAAAPAIGAAVALTMLFSAPSSDVEPAWHLVVCSAVWSGLLVAAFAFVLLRIRTRRVPVGSAVALGLVGLGLAALMRVACPDLQLLPWWRATTAGRSADVLMGASGGAFCLGICGAGTIGLAACLVLGRRRDHLGGVIAPAIALSLLLLPAVILQSSDMPVEIGLAWAGGAALGSYAGIAAAQWIGAARASRRVTGP